MPAAIAEGQCLAPIVLPDCHASSTATQAELQAFSAEFARLPFAAIAKHSLHELMSRSGSFPLHLALRLLRDHAPGASVVFDPFCGKGTVPFAARLLGKPVFATDIAPEAVLCSRAKLAPVSLQSVASYIGALPRRRMNIRAIPEDVRVFFHEETLGELLAVRLALESDLAYPARASNALFTFALLLGILHGHASYSLSIPSAHAYSMAPRYVKNYAELRGLRPPRRDVYQCLLAKAARCLRDPLPPPVPSTIRHASALRLLETFPELAGTIDVILTSPPYLNAQTYAKDNWLRLWLLGYDYKDLQREYLETSSLTKYRTWMITFLNEVRALLRPGGRVILVTGDVRRRNRLTSREPVPIIRTAELHREALADVRDITVNTIVPQRVRGNGRYFHALSRSNGHQPHDLIERVLFATKRGSNV